MGGQTIYYKIQDKNIEDFFQKSNLYFGILNYGDPAIVLKLC